MLRRCTPPAAADRQALIAEIACRPIPRRTARRAQLASNTGVAEETRRPAKGRDHSTLFTQGSQAIQRNLELARPLGPAAGANRWTTYRGSCTLRGGARLAGQDQAGDSPFDLRQHLDAQQQDTIDWTASAGSQIRGWKACSGGLTLFAQSD